MRETEIFGKYLEGLKAAASSSALSQMAAGNFTEAQVLAGKATMLETLVFDIKKLEKDPTEFVKEYFRESK